MSMSSRSKRHEKIATGSEITAGAAKKSAEGVAKGAASAVETTSNFQYAPTLIALFPVFASFFFGSHTEHWTDLILLGLVAVYLHKCVSVPWNYYKVSKKRYKTSDKERMTDKQREVSKQLRIAQIQAFIGLILGPLLGAALLHYVRQSMARPANGLITNFNINVFVLAAEMRPLNIAYKYLNARSEDLQEELVDVLPGRYEELMKKVDTLEGTLGSLRTKSERVSPLKENIRSPSMARDDAAGVEELRQALRRFERHEAQLNSQHEEKLYALERKMADFGNRTHLSSNESADLGHLVRSAFTLPIRLAWSVLMLPVTMLRWSLHLLAQTQRELA